MPDTAALDPAVSGVLRQPFAEQVAFFRGKLGNLVPTERWTDMLRGAHDRGFMVAGAQSADLLAGFAAAVEKTQSQGGSLDAFRKDFASLVDGIDSALSGTGHRPHRVATIDGDELGWVLDEGRRVIKAVEARKPSCPHEVSTLLRAALTTAHEQTR